MLFYPGKIRCKSKYPTTCMPKFEIQTNMLNKGMIEI